MHVPAPLPFVLGYMNANHRWSHPGMGHGLELYLSIQSQPLRMLFLGSHQCPTDIDSADLLQHPLWMPTSTPLTVTVLPVANAVNISLIGSGPPNSTGAWITSTMLLIPAEGNFQWSLGFLSMNPSHMKCFSSASPTNMATPLPTMLKHGYRTPGAMDGSKESNAAPSTSLFWFSLGHS